MKFLINEQIESEPDGYYISIKTIGCSDREDEINIGPYDESELSELEDIILTCDRMIEKFPDGKGGYRGYWDVPGFEEWFDEEWPGYEGTVDSISYYEVTYVKDGIAYSVDIIKE